MLGFISSVTSYRLVLDTRDSIRGESRGTYPAQLAPPGESGAGARSEGSAVAVQAPPEEPPALPSQGTQVLADSAQAGPQQPCYLAQKARVALCPISAWDCQYNTHPACLPPGPPRHVAEASRPSGLGDL